MEDVGWGWGGGVEEGEGGEEEGEGGGDGVWGDVEGGVRGVALAQCCGDLVGERLGCERCMH